jgi:diacylglycerol kinase (ATP)
MRVLLVHKKSAGRGDHSAEDLERLIRDAGHVLADSIDDLEKVAPALRAGPELVAVAGGDGSVGKVAKEAARAGVPLAILPVGTANNIARTFGLHREPAELVAGWHRGRLRDADLARVHAFGEEHRFVEAFGLGAFARAMHAASGAHGLADDVDDVLDRDRKLLRRVLNHAPADAYDISLDGEELSGRYLMVAVMNIPFLGPRVQLAPDADPGDGLLDVVLVAEEHREALREHLAALREDAAARAPALSVRRARRVTIGARDVPAHRDGKREPDGGEVRVAIAVEPGALRLLVPAA